jgi:hypothetical protein
MTSFGVFAQLPLDGLGILQSTASRQENATRLPKTTKGVGQTAVSLQN